MTILYQIGFLSFLVLAIAYIFYRKGKKNEYNRIKAASASIVQKQRDIANLPDCDRAGVLKWLRDKRDH